MARLIEFIRQNQIKFVISKSKNLRVDYVYNLGQLKRDSVHLVAVVDHWIFMLCPWLGRVQRNEGKFCAGPASLERRVCSSYLQVKEIEVKEENIQSNVNHSVQVVDKLDNDGFREPQTPKECMDQMIKVNEAVQLVSLVNSLWRVYDLFSLPILIKN